MFLKYGVTPEKIIEFASNPDFNLPDDIFSNREWRIKKDKWKMFKDSNRV